MEQMLDISRLRRWRHAVALHLRVAEFWHQRRRSQRCEGANISEDLRIKNDCLPPHPPSSSFPRPTYSPLHPIRHTRHPPSPFPHHLVAPYTVLLTYKRNICAVAWLPQPAF